MKGILWKGNLYNIPGRKLSLSLQPLTYILFFRAMFWFYILVPRETKWKNTQACTNCIYYHSRSSSNILTLQELLPMHQTLCCKLFDLHLIYPWCCHHLHFAEEKTEAREYRQLPRFFCWKFRAVRESWQPLLQMRLQIQPLSNTHWCKAALPLFTTSVRLRHD